MQKVSILVDNCLLPICKIYDPRIRSNIKEGPLQVYHSPQKEKAWILKRRHPPGKPFFEKYGPLEKQKSLGHDSQSPDEKFIFSDIEHKINSALNK